MSPTGFKPKKGDYLRVVMDFVFGFENKRGEIMDHWVAFVDNFNFPPQEFYTAIETELAARKIPNMEISRDDFAEGGLLSDRRLYLRMFRERLALYTCASPFGTGYFYSCWTVHVPALVRLWHILALFGLFGGVSFLLLKPLGLAFTALAMIALIIAIAGVFQNATAAALSDLDTLLLKIPVISTIYEDWFREDTYYRVDTRLLYLKKVPEMVRAVAEEITAAHGAKLVKWYDRAPIFGELYKPVRPIIEPEILPEQP